MTGDPTREVGGEAEVLIGHLAEYGELLDLLSERPGLVVVDGDPLSGTSGLLGAATRSLPAPWVRCDARPCLDALDLAMAIADTAVATLAGDAAEWWMGRAAPSSTAGLRLSRTVGPTGIDIQAIQDGNGNGLRRIADAIDLLVAIDAEAGLVIDHLGLMLAAMSADTRRALLGELRAARQRHPGLDLVLVEHSAGPMAGALAEPDHPLFQAGQLVRIRRAAPSRFVDDLARSETREEVAVELLGAAAELAAGIPCLTWQVVELSPGPAGVAAGWRRLRSATQAATGRQWDLLRQVHPQAQPVVAAMGVGLRPHSVAANAKSINDALNRLRGLGIAWQPEHRQWSIGDPLLRAWVGENAPSWARRRRVRAA